MSIDTPVPTHHMEPPPPGAPSVPPGERPASRHHQASAWLMRVGALLVVLAVVFALVGIPALVRLPLTTDQTVHYDGTFSLFVNQSTLEPLAKPTILPLTVSRQVRVRNGSFATAVVTEQNTIRPGSLTYHQNFQYVMNRRTMAFENGPLTMMFDQPAKTDIAGSYRVNFPLGTTASGSYPVWNTETDKSVAVTDGRGPQALPGVSGVQVIEFTSDVTGPVSPYYHQWLVHNGFPSSITPAQLQPRLEALGVNVPAVLGTLLPVLTPAQRSLVDQVLAAPVPLNYTYFYRGIVGVEPRTGAMIWVDTTAEGVKVAPSLAGVDRLRPLLDKNIAIPAVATLSSALVRLAATPPQTVVDYMWDQTRTSSQQMANFAQSQIRTMDLVDGVPWVVGGIGVVLIALGLVLRRRRSGGAGEPTVTTTDLGGR